MANNIGYSVPSVFVNNVPISIVPNSAKFTLGKGAVKVRAASNGGGASVSVHTEDAESKIGKIKFALYVKPENIALSSAWKSLIGANAVQFIQAGQVPISLQNASQVNDPDWEATADGKVEIEFEGDPINSIF